MRLLLAMMLQMMGRGNWHKNMHLIILRLKLIHVIRLTLTRQTLPIAVDGISAMHTGMHPVSMLLL